MPPMAAPPIPPTRFIFFVGSGGVGKSSCAAAAAVTLTEKEGPVLLLSIDPSHSLSDVLQSRQLKHRGYFIALMHHLHSEPMIAPGIHELAAALKKAGYHLTIETAATVAPDGIACDLASLSPKLRNSAPDARLAPGRDPELRLMRIRMMLVVGATFVVAVGLGERRRTYDGETLRRAAGAAAR